MEKTYRITTEITHPFFYCLLHSTFFVYGPTKEGKAREGEGERERERELGRVFVVDIHDEDDIGLGTVFSA